MPTGTDPRLEGLKVVFVIAVLGQGDDLRAGTEELGGRVKVEEIREEIQKRASRDP